MVTTNNNVTIVSYDFENPINHADKDYDEDCELPKELARLLKQESKVIQSHDESVETINFRTNEKLRKSE